MTDPAGELRVVLVWEFYGPRGRGTADHYTVHLLEFLAKELIPDGTVEVTDQGPFQSTVRCSLPEAHAAKVEKALRPKRREST